MTIIAITDPTPVIMEIRAPLYKVFHPSFFTIFFSQSIIPSYFTSSPEVIIILLITVSKGYEHIPAIIVTTKPTTVLFFSFSPKKCMTTP